MNYLDLIHSHVTAEPSMLRPYGFGEDDTRSPEDLDPEYTRQHIDLAHRCWLAVLAGEPTPEALPSQLKRALPGMQAAADWTTRFPQHPALVALLAELRHPPLFLLLSHCVLWQDQERTDLYVTGMSSGLYPEDGMLDVPEYACDNTLDVSGLLGVAHSDDRRDDMDWLDVVVWPRPRFWIARWTEKTR
jgi:hypothetical protein